MHTHKSKKKKEHNWFTRIYNKWVKRFDVDYSTSTNYLEGTSENLGLDKADITNPHSYIA